MAETFIYKAGVHTLDDLEAHARLILPPEVFDFVAGGAGDERTVLANVDGFRRYQLRSHILRDVRNVSTAVNIAGTEFTSPILVAPTGGVGIVRRDAELAKARAAARAGIGYVMPLGSINTLEEVASVAGNARWFQVYWQVERDIVVDLVRRAEEAAFRAIVLTVDAPVPALRRRMMRNGYRVPAEHLFGNFVQYADRSMAQTESSNPADGSLSWKDVEWLRSVTPLPLVLKGIMTAEDAKLAVAAGVQAVVVSNHGGRQLDAEPGTVEVLEEIVDAVGGEIPVILDGGVRGATDIVTALALGADAVSLGRPVIWALACGGEAAIEAMLSDLASDLKRTLALVGAGSVGVLDRSYVRESTR